MAELLTLTLINRESDDGTVLKKIKKDEDSEDAGEPQGDEVKKEGSDES